MNCPHSKNADNCVPCKEAAERRAKLETIIPVNYEITISVGTAGDLKEALYLAEYMLKFAAAYEEKGQNLPSYIKVSTSPASEREIHNWRYR